MHGGMGVLLGCCCRPYVTTTRPNCSILNPQKPRCLKPIQLLSLATAPTRSRGLKNECTALLEERKNPRTTIKTSSRVEKCRGVEKQVSASGGRSSAWVIDCPPTPPGSRARPRLDLLRFKKWICLVGEAYFFPAFGLLIVGKEASGNRKSHSSAGGSQGFLIKTWSRI